MTHLLSIPDNLHLFPCLDHNDLLRLRRVSKQTKALADTYLSTPKLGHQGKWELKIDPSKEGETLEAFFQKGLPPPAQLHIANRTATEPFFEDEHLEEFMRRYSKYVSNLRLDNLVIPFTSAKEIGFYESLVNLEKLCCNKLITVGGTARFEEKTRMAEGSFLIIPTWSKKLKVFKLNYTNCMDAMWSFINGVSNNLKELLHPFPSSGANFAPVRELIERRGGIKSQRKLLYDWRYLSQSEPLELHRVFASCRDNGVLIKNLDASNLHCLLSVHKGLVDKIEFLEPKTGELTFWALKNYKKNKFLGSVIHSLTGVNEVEFFMDLPALEEISARTDRPMHGYGRARWPNLRKINLQLNYCEMAQIDVLCGQTKRRPKLVELSLTYGCQLFSWIRPCPRNFVECCGNLKKLTINNCTGDSGFFVELWEGLPLLEDVTLVGCQKLTNKGFIGGDKSRPVFRSLEKLKHLTIMNTGVTDAAFRDVFRHLKLTSFKVFSGKAIKKITVTGIKKLLTGPFAETIVKLDLDLDVSKEELKQVLSCFRSSKML